MPSNDLDKPAYSCTQGTVVQSIVSLTSSLKVILLTVLVDSIHKKKYSDIFC